MTTKTQMVKPFVRSDNAQIDGVTIDSEMANKELVTNVVDVHQKKD